MEYKAHKYQEYATEFILTHPIAAVFLDMGLGKTAITLTALYDLMLDSFEIRKTLVIAPLRVCTNVWPMEIEKWDHLEGLSYSLAIGTARERKAALQRKAFVYIINRENVQWLVEESSIPFDFDMIVIDELSSFKSRTSKRFKALLKVRPKARRIVGLTGTPASNGLMDLWAEFRVLDLGERLGRYITAYRQRFFDPDKRNQTTIFSYKPKAGAEKSIYQLISDVTISMQSKDHLKLPALVENEVKVYLSEEERKIYKTLKEEMVLELKGEEIDAINAAVLSGKLLQIANGMIYSEDGNSVQVHDRKLDALEDLIEAANGKPVLIAYWFKHDKARIKKRTGARELKTTLDIKDWNEGNIPVALIHPQSAGHGLNLQAGGSTLIWFSLIWSLELYLQTNARIYRQGQDETVVIHHLIAEGTIDEYVKAALRKKDNIQSSLIEAVKVSLGGI